MKPAADSALLAAILGEEAALYAYGVAAPHLDDADRDRALGGLAAHRARVLVLRGRANDAEESGAPGGFITGPVDYYRLTPLRPSLLPSACSHNAAKMRWMSRKCLSLPSHPHPRLFRPSLSPESSPCSPTTQKCVPRKCHKFSLSVAA